MGVNLDYGDFEKWFEKEASKVFMDFMKNVAAILDEVDRQIKAVSQNFDESLMERITRDLKADAFDKVDLLLGSLM